MPSVLITDVQPDDLIDLEGIDESPANQQIWPFEYAHVESVSTLDRPSGGWVDGCLALEPDIAIVYLHNGAVPAVVPITAVVNREGHEAT